MGVNSASIAFQSELDTITRGWIDYLVDARILALAVLFMRALIGDYALGRPPFCTKRNANFVFAYIVNTINKRISIGLFVLLN